MRGVDNHHLLCARLRESVDELGKLFGRDSNKYSIHRSAKPLLEQFSRDEKILPAILEHHIRNGDLFRTRHYPVVSVRIASNAHFDLVANCWIPLPDGGTNLSTKAIHHHGALLLSTANIYGPGYEHWVFSSPKQIEPHNNLFRMQLRDRELHGLHEIAFVDTYEPHCPFYPPSLTITLALWSNSHPTSWKDFIKRVPLLKQNERRLKRLAQRTGFTKHLDLKVVEFFDFFPVKGGFECMQERKEFPLGPEQDHLQSFLHVVQNTGNSHLVSLMEQQLREQESSLGARGGAIRKMLTDLRAGRTIVGKLSAGHTGVPYANFTREAVEASLRDLKRENSYARQFTSSPSF